MYTLPLIGLILSVFGLLSQAIPLPRQSQCENPTRRVEWRSLTLEQRTAFTDAVLCLTTQRSVLSTSIASRSLYDDFTEVHAALNHDIHYVAQFLPWHRYFLHLRELALVQKCGYTGPIPYWDWTSDADADAVPTSPIWDAVGGFGGNGNPDEGYEVQDGPFANLLVNISSIEFIFDATIVVPKPHKLTRMFNNDNGQALAGMGNMNMNMNMNMRAEYYNSEAVGKINELDSFEDFSVALEYLHGPVHSATGGDVASISISPNDPIFFIHHTQIDRLWAKWQAAKPESRLMDYAGNPKPRSRPSPTPSPTLFPTTTTTPAARANLSDTIEFKSLASAFGLQNRIPVGEVMDIESGPFCYEYAT